MLILSTIMSNWVELGNILTSNIENKNENKLPIIITTKFDKEGLLHKFEQSNDKGLSDAIIQKLYQMCYGIELNRYDKNQEEKTSTSDKTKC